MIDANYSERTWYEATADRGLPHPTLSGKIEAQVCVVGGGLAGLTTALELARRGISVALLEAKRMAWGASGRNGGFVSNGFAWACDEIAGKVGLDAAAGGLLRLLGMAPNMCGARSRKGPFDPHGRRLARLHRYNNADEKRAEVEGKRRHFDQEKRFLDIGETRALVNTQRYFQSALDPTAFHMHPLRYALMIAAKAQKPGRCSKWRPPSRP